MRRSDRTPSPPVREIFKFCMLLLPLLLGDATRGLPLGSRIDAGTKELYGGVCSWSTLVSSASLILLFPAHCSLRAQRAGCWEIFTAFVSQFPRL